MLPDKFVELAVVHDPGEPFATDGVGWKVQIGSGFFVPPLGIIDGSVLTAVGELLMFGVLAQVPKILDAVRNGKPIKLQKGDFGVEVSAEAKEEN